MGWRDVLRSIFNLKEAEAPAQPQEPQLPRMGVVVAGGRFAGSIVAVVTPNGAGATLPPRPDRGLSQMRGVESGGYPAPHMIYDGQGVISGPGLYTEGSTYIEIFEQGHTLVVAGADIGKDGWVRGGQVFFDEAVVPADKNGDVHLSEIPVMGWRFSKSSAKNAPKPSDP